MLADSFLGDDGAIVIANALKSNTAAKHLDLRGNNIRNDGAISISQLLKVNNVISRFDQLFIDRSNHFEQNTDIPSQYEPRVELHWNMG